MSTENKLLSRRDFVSAVEPRWCSGCGCYSVLRALTDTFPAMGIPKEQFAVISGIGCSSRLPYYLSTYGFHTIHGRAPTVALGLKLANPKQSVWVITGDGDGLSIGGNHFIHLMRRNPDMKVSLFNNRIYGLTKGQTSPTTPTGTKTKTAPYGSIDTPMHPLSLAIAAGATFAARVPGTDLRMLREVYKEAAAHKGVAFIEVMLNCVIFNDGAFESINNPETATDSILKLVTGQPLVFGKNQDKGIRFVNGRPEIVWLSQPGGSPAEKEGLYIHDPAQADPSLAFLLSKVETHKGLPMPVGVFRKVSAPTFEDELVDLSGGGDLNLVLQGSEAFEIDARGETRPLTVASGGDSGE